MEVIKARPAIHVNFIRADVEISIFSSLGGKTISIPLEFVPDVAKAMQELFDDIHGD